MAFPTTSVLDNFTRADASLYTGNWTDIAISGENGATLRVISNQLGMSSAAASDAFWNASTFGPDVEAFVTVATLSSSNNGCELYARLTGTGATATGYLIYYERQAGTDIFQVYRLDAGATFVQLGADFTQEVSAGDSIGLSVVGTTITVWYKAAAGAWTSLGTRTDATYAGTNSRIGVEIDNNTVIRLDDFGGGTVVGGGTTFTRTVTDNLGGQTATPATLTASFRTTTDNIGVNTTTARQSAGFRTVADNLGISDAVSRLAASLRVLSNNLGISDLTLRLATSFRLVSDNFAIADSVTIQDITAGVYLLHIAESIGFITSASTLTSSSRSMSDPLGVSEFPFRTDSAFLAVGDSFGLSTSAARIANCLRLATDLLGFSTLASRTAASSRLVADSLAIADSFSILDIPAGVLILRVTELLGMSDSASRQQAAFRLLADSLAISTAFGTSSALNRTVADSLGLIDAASRQVDSARLVSDAIGLLTLASSLVPTGTFLPDNRNVTGLPSGNRTVLGRAPNV